MNAKTPRHQGKKKRGTTLVFLCTLGVLASWRSSFGQEAQPTESTQTVYVSDSTTAVERMALAERMERLKEWNKAADLYQEVLEKYSDRVVPTGNQPAGSATQYTTVATAVQDRLGKWPADGLRVYRARYETTAKSMLESAAGDPAALSRIVSLYFPTDSAKVAAIQLMDLQLESGDFAAVAYTGQRLLSSHPDLSAARPMVLYRTALALHSCGDDALAKALLADLQKNSPDALGTIAGNDVKLVDALQRELASPLPSVAQSGGESWPTFMGGYDRDRVTTATGKPSARIAKIDYAKPPYRMGNRANVAQLKKDDEADRDAGRMLGIMPVADHGELFFTDGCKIYGVSIDSGFPLPGWLATYPQGGAYSAQTWPTPRDQQLSLTVTPSDVVAVMGLSDKTAYAAAIQAAQPQNRLVSLDRTTGKLKWECVPSTFDGNFANLKTAEFSGSPIAMGDSIYVAARLAKGGNQFEDSYLVCLDAATGKPRWSTYVSSASNATAAWMDPSLTRDENAIHLAYSGGRLYICTNLGAVGCIDAYSGRILWLNLYPREVQQDMRRIQLGGTGDSQQPPTRPWAFNAPVIDSGKVFVLPTDSKQLFIYDAGSGREIKRVDMNDLVKDIPGGDEAPPDTLLNVTRNRIILAGTTRVYCVDWPKYDHGTFNAEDFTAMLWREPPIGQATAIKGRGFVTSDSLYLPKEDRLLTFNLRTGKIVEAMPPSPATWDHGQGRGNIIVADGHVIIAGGSSLEIRTDLSLARAKLDAAVTAHPTDAAPHLAYAETMFNAGQSQIALEQLDTAISMIHSQAEKDRLFNLCMTSARSSMNSGDLAEKLFDRAASSATTPDQKSRYLLQRAKFYDIAKKPTDELKLLHEVLAAEATRNVIVADEDTGNTSRAAAIAEKEVADVIKVQGTDIYAPYESAAKNALAAAGPEPTVLLNIAQSYPNSTAAPQALLAAANFYESANNHAIAIQTLRQLSFKYPDAIDRAKLIEDLARNYLAMPNRAEAAVARLTYGARMFASTKLSKPLQLPNGKTLTDVTFTQAASALRDAVGDSQTLALPDFQFPRFGKGVKVPRDPFLPESPGQVVANVTNILSPQRGYQRFDRLLAYQPGKGLSCFAIGSINPLWTSQMGETPKDAAWVGDDLLTWRDETIVMTSSKGAALWKLSLKDTPAPDSVVQADDSAAEADVATAPQPVQAQNFRRIRQQVIVINGAPRVVPIMNGPVNGAGNGSESIAFVKPILDRIVLATSAGRVLALSPADGHIIWQMKLSAQPIDCFAASDEFVVARTAEDSAINLTVLDATDGEPTFRKSFAPDAHAPMNVALSVDGTLVYTTYDRLCGKDLYDPSPNLTYEVLPGIENEPVFLGMGQPDQLMIQGNKVLAVASQGAYIRVHSLYDGKVVKSSEGIDVMPPTQVSNETNIHLRTCGDEFYAFSPRSIIAYNTSNQSGWSPTLSPNVNYGFREVYIGSDYLLLEGNAFGKETLAAFWRGSDDKGRESGNWVFDRHITHPAGVRQVMPVEGGLYYLAMDNTLHFLKGARSN